MLSISRILTLLAGALISAALLKRKENSNAGAKPWRTDLGELQAKFTRQLDSRDNELAARLAEFQPKMEALAVELAVRPDGRIDDLAAQLTRLQPKIEALALELAPKPDPRVDDLAAQMARLQPRIEALAAASAPKPDPRVDDLTVRLAAVESKAHTTADKVEALKERVNTQDQTLQATNQVVVAIEQLLNSKIADFDQRIEAQGRSLQAMNSSIAQSDELLERVLDLVQNLSPVPAESREPISIASGGGEIRELQL
jgi:chromosome segregation ATPase